MDWIMNMFIKNLLGSQKVRLAIGGTLTALAFKACAFLSAQFGFVITPDDATVKQFVDWIFGLTAAAIAGHAVQNIGSTSGPDVPPPPPPIPGQ